MSDLYFSDIVNALEWSSEKMSAEDLDDDKVGSDFFTMLPDFYSLPGGFRFHIAISLLIMWA